MPASPIVFKKKMYIECPLCKENHPMSMYGHVFVTNKDIEMRQSWDMGYAFCNCNNIFYTDWENIKKSMYDEEYEQKYDGAKPYVEKVCEYVFPELKKHTEIKSFLEIGSINTYVLDYAKKQGYKTLGTDIKDRKVKREHDFIVADLDDGLYTQGHDVIWASHIFEHIKNPIVFIKNLYESLNDKGLLFIAMPDVGTINWQNALGWGHWHVREHYTLWEMLSFIEFAEKYGFKCVFKERHVVEFGMHSNDFFVILQKG